MAYAIRIEITDPTARIFDFPRQPTMYAGRWIAAGDTDYLFASENEGGQGLIARDRHRRLPRHLLLRLYRLASPSAAWTMRATKRRREDARHDPCSRHRPGHDLQPGDALRP